VMMGDGITLEDFVELNSLVSGINQKVNDIHKWINGNGQPGARDRMTKMEHSLDRTAALTETNSIHIAELGKAIAELKENCASIRANAESAANKAAELAIDKHRNSPLHNLGWQMWSNPKVLLPWSLVIVLIVYLVFSGHVSIVDLTTIF